LERERAEVREVAEEIQGAADNIRGDWTDPRSDCRAIWEQVARLRAIVGVKENL
jgi:hypothetical protein